MNKILKSIIFISLLLLVLPTACNLPVGAATATETPTQALILSSTKIPAPTLTSIPPAPTSIPPSPTPEFAPFCNSDTTDIPQAAQCQMPLAGEITKFCVEKKPYNVISISPGSTYQPLTESFTCRNEGMKDYQQLISCTGTKSKTFEVSVCNPTCVAPTAQAAVTKCPQDYTYNAIQGCCTREAAQQPPPSQNCVVLKLDTPGCALNCRDYTKAECLNHAYACAWTEGACEPRK